MCVWGGGNSAVVSGSAARAGAALGWLVVLAVLRKLRDRQTTGDTAVQEQGIPTRKLSRAGKQGKLKRWAVSRAAVAPR
jgi:hypothetical protein